MAARILLIFCLLCIIKQSVSVVVGIDLGSQWFKISMVKPGSFDLVLNEQSSRKTSTVVGWNRGERFFGADGLNLLVRNPATVYPYVTQLLGKAYNHPAVNEAKDHFGYTLLEDTERGTYKIQYDHNNTYLPEEIVGMILRNAKALASVAADGTNVKDCVITVPPFLTSHERQALIDAAELAGFNVLSLINDITAFALNYAKDRNFDNDTQNVIFYDMGGSSTKAILVTFQSVADVRSAKKNKTVSQILVRSHAWDESLGGRTLDHRIVAHFKKLIKEKYSQAPVDDVRLTLRLLKDAQKLKEVLSANQAANTAIGAIGDYEDFPVTVTRQQFEEMNKDLWARALVPLQKVLTESGLDKSEVQFVEIVGGSSRVPKIQAVIKEFMGRTELDKHVNGDEGAAHGAAFFAAGLSPQFRVKEVRVRDVTTLPISVKISTEESSIIDAADDEEAVVAAPEGEEALTASANTTTALFKYHNRLNTRKGLTFYTYSNFSLELAYDKPESLSAGSSALIKTIAVTGVPTSEKYNLTGKPKIHASFRLDASGIVSLDHAEAEITVLTWAPKVEPKKVAEKTTTSVPEGDKTAEEVKTEVPEAEGAEQAEADKTAKTEDGKSEPTADAAAEEKKEDVSDKAGGAEAKADAPEAGDSPAAAKTEPVEVPMELVKKVMKVPLKLAPKALGPQSFTVDVKINAQTRLSSQDFLDQQRKDLQAAKNSLEAFIYDTRDKLYNEEIIEASTESEREALSTALSQTSEWLEETEDALASEYRFKLRTVKDMADKIHFRVKEKTALPDSVAELKSTLNVTTTVLTTVSNVLNVTEEDIERVSSLVTETTLWLTAKLEDQEKLAANVDPVLTSEEVLRKRKDIDFQMKLLMRKPKKKIVIPKNDTVDANATQADATDGLKTEQPVDETGAKPEAAEPKEDLPKDEAGDKYDEPQEEVKQEQSKPKEADAKKKTEDLKKKAEDVKKKAEDARKKEEEAKKKRTSEDSKKKEDSKKNKKEESFKTSKPKPSDKKDSSKDKTKPTDKKQDKKTTTKPKEKPTKAPQATPYDEL